MTRLIKLLCLSAALAWGGGRSAEASTLQGPARFCGYSPIIDLLPDEKVTTSSGGIHAGSFLWEGAFGSLDVTGVGWGRPPKGRTLRAQMGAKPAMFAQRREGKRYVVAIWNGEHGVAYFSSGKPFTAPQLEAVGRVTLFEEGQTPSGCHLRTAFSWE